MNELKETEVTPKAREAEQNGNFELLVRIKNGDESALEALVRENLGLVKKIALRFTGRGADYEDLIQIGVIGMIKAARSFDFDYCTVFSTYAVPLIMGEIRRFLRDDGPIKVGRGLKKRGMEIMRARQRFLAEHGREPRLSELCEHTSLSEEEIAESMEAVSGVVSLSEPINGEEGGVTLESSIADDSMVLERLTDRIALSEAIRRLPQLWREIIRLRYFKDLSQSETGRVLGLTQVKISREEQKILTELKKALI